MTEARSAGGQSQPSLTGAGVESRARARFAVLLALMLGLSLAAVEATVVGTAMPKAVASLGGVAIYSWLFTAYLLTSLVTTPVWGKLSDLYGRRRTYVAGIAVFLAGTALSGTAASMLQLILFRAVQGLGAGAILVLTFTIVGEKFPLPQRARAQGYLTAVWGIASLLGPPVGGFIADTIGWRWVFYVNIPFGLAAIGLVLSFLTESRPTVKTSFDLQGTALFATAATSVLLVLNGYAALGSWTYVVLVVLAVSLPAFVAVERRVAAPLIPLSVFRTKMVRTAAIGNFLSGFAFFGSVAYVPILLQWVMGMPTADAGVVFIPYIMAWVLSANVSVRLLTRITTKVLVMSGGALLVLGMVLLALGGEALPRIVTAETLSGLGMGIMIPTLLISTQTLVAREVLGITTSLLNFLNQMGAAVGVALMWVPISGALANFNPSGGSTVVLTASERAALGGGLGTAFLMAAVSAAVLLPLFLTLPRIKLGEPRTYPVGGSRPVGPSDSKAGAE